jgi:exoribonuclease II
MANVRNVKIQGTSLDRRKKITDEMRDAIKTIRITQGLSYDKIANMFNISKRSVDFILHPERLEKCKQQFKLRRTDGRYYNSEKNAMSIKNTIDYKVGLINEGKVKKIKNK